MDERYAPGKSRLQADGGRPQPGVPATGEDRSESPSRTASGRRMPGVPKTTGDPEAEAAASGSCESAATEGQDEPDHDLTTAFTFEALTRLGNPAGVLNAARSWSDWVGMVGEADVPTMNTFLRRRQLAVDFFNGGNEGPADRLTAIATGDSPFQEDRLVLVGLEEQSWIATEAGWEFEPLEAAADEAGWTLR